MVLFIPEKIKDLVDGWILKSDRRCEMGGAFFGTDTEIKAFLPIPNFSKTPVHEFDRGNSRYYEAVFADVIGVPIIAGMHTHPNGTIPSEGDGRYIHSRTDIVYEVVISDMGNELRWFCFDRNLRHVHIYFKDVELEKSVALLSDSFGLTDLGRCMITRGAELLCENERGRQFLKLDEDSYKVWLWLEANKKNWKKTKIQIHRDTGLSLKRIDVALNKLGTKL